MDVEIKVTVTAPDGTTRTDTIGKLTKGFETIGEIGLSIDESKTLLLNIQQKIVDAQCAAFCAERAYCQCCGRKLRCKAHRQVRYRSVSATSVSTVPVSTIANATMDRPRPSVP
ncbi:hypothetical protein FJU08_22570 [Martelella alba]|uniref:Uncharacterized protein n=1 Tax=Martelella alba TaxID=2590451 RepID=A0A506TYY6_9HYPH|nr:hypothetical protein [Martelella alba]TPW26201.1 hypothetical protein FJU08_22570 [Martelella alba]